MKKTQLVALLVCVLFTACKKKSEDSVSPTSIQLYPNYNWIAAASALNSQDTLKVENGYMYKSLYGRNGSSSQDGLSTLWNKGGLSEDFEITIAYSELKASTDYRVSPLFVSLTDKSLTLATTTYISVGRALTAIQFNNSVGFPTVVSDTKESFSGTISIKRLAGNLRVTLVKNYNDGTSDLQYVQEATKANWYTGDAQCTLMALNGSTDRASIKVTSFTVKNANGVLTDSFMSPSIYYAK